MVPKIQSIIFRPYASHLITGGPGDVKYVEAVRLIRKTEYAGSKYQIFCPYTEPRADIRHGTFEMSIEGYESYKPVKVNIEQVSESKEILDLLKSETTTVGILGAQFFDMDLPEVVHKLKKDGRFIVVAGVDKTYEGDPFGPIGYLAIDADHISKFYTKCEFPGCRNTGTRTQKIANGRPAGWGGKITDLREGVTYKNVCLLHHSCPGSPEEKKLGAYKGIRGDSVGSLTVFFGSMNSGKSEMMIAKTLERAKETGFEYVFAKARKDARTPKKVVSRSFAESGKFGIEFPAAEIDENDMWDFAEQAKSWKKRIIGIDESQFIENISLFANALRLLGHEVVIAGLAKDFRGLLFGEMDYLICEAENVEPLEAACTEKGCGNKATEILRLIDGKPADYNSPIVVLDSDGTKKTNVEYAPRCVFHHVVPNKPEYIEKNPRRRTK